MTEVTAQNFGFLIAYILPGLVVLTALSKYSETVRSWLGASAATAPTVGGFLYITLASVAAGMTVSAIRWLLLDPLHHVTGIHQPKWDFAELQDRLNAFLSMVENHYRYYQFYSNMCVALVIFAVVEWPLRPTPFGRPGTSTIIMFALIGIFYVSSRDTLQKYYARTAVLLDSIPQKERSEIMTNGCGMEEHFAEKQKPTVKTSKRKEGREQSTPKSKSTSIRQKASRR